MPNQKNPTEVIHDLLELVSRVNFALDDSEEFEGPNGRSHSINGQDFDDICEAIHWFEELPGLDPLRKLGPATKAELALRSVFKTAWQLSDTRGRNLVLVDLLRSSLGPLEVSAAMVESDDTEQMEGLITRIKDALLLHDTMEAISATANDGNVPPSLRPSDLVNTAGILASDMPGVVVTKLDAAYDSAQAKGVL